jgi:hypothetical protein
MTRSGNRTFPDRITCAQGALAVPVQFGQSARVTGIGVGLRAALVLAAALAACGQEDEVQVIDDYEVLVDTATNTLRVLAEPCGDLRVSTMESSDEVRLTVSLMEGGDCLGSESPLVTLTRPLAGRSIVDDETGDVVTLIAADG